MGITTLFRKSVNLHRNNAMYTGEMRKVPGGTDILCFLCIDSRWPQAVASVLTDVQFSGVNPLIIHLWVH